jgi:hypothetical protein
MRNVILGYKPKLRGNKARKHRGIFPVLAKPLVNALMAAYWANLHSAGTEVIRYC